MSKLDELIAELCPDGVEYRPIGELAKYEQPGKYIVKSTDYNDSFRTPVLTAGQSFILGYTNETDGLYPATKEDPVIIFDDFTGAFKWVDFPFKVKSSAMKMLNANEEIASLRYIFHLMGWLNFSSSEHKRLWIGIYSEFKVPVPPLEVQREIVRVLDNFTFLSAELSTELSVELSARRKQYEYYCNRVFDFEDCSSFSIVDIADTSIGLATSVTKHKREAGVRLLHNSDIQPNHIVLKKIEYVSEEFATKNAGKILHKNDIITVHTGDVGTSAVIDDEYDGSIGFTTITTRIRNRKMVLPQYLCYYLNSHRCKVDIATMTISDRSNLNQKSFEKLVIPIPSIEKQKSVIAILDRFDALCSEIISGLPAEIEARQKQYEYYRDKLLSFKEKENTNEKQAY